MNCDALSLITFRKFNANYFFQKIEKLLEGENKRDLQEGQKRKRSKIKIVELSPWHYT